MHYELYIDVLFLENFMIDSLLLLTINRILQWERNYGRILFAGMLGSLLTCLVMIVSIPVWLKSSLFYAGIPCLMIVVMEKERSMLRLGRGIALLYLLAVFLGGILTLFRPYLRYISLFYGLAVISTQGMLLVWKLFRRVKTEQVRCCKVTLYTESEAYTIKGLIDTGNCLTDPICGEGVHVLDCTFYEQMFQKQLESFSVCGTEAVSEERMHYIPYRSVSGTGIMKVFRIEKMCVEKEKKQWVEHPLIGVSESPICADGSYQLILNHSVL